MEYKAPKFLYKYRAATTDKDLKRIEDLIKNGSIYFGSSFDFNDIFDCKPVLSFAAGDEEFVKRMLDYSQQRAKKEGKILDVRRTEADLRATFGTSKDPRIPSVGKELQKKFGENLEKWGVFCAAERGDNLLMWSHYANSFSGVCFEILTDFFGWLRPVDYYEKRPIINVVPGMESNGDIIAKTFFSKSSDWKYEQEWRGLGDKGTANLRIDGIRRIIFGPKCPQNVREKIFGFVNESNRIIRFANAYPNDSEFTLDIVNF